MSFLWTCKYVFILFVHEGVPFAKVLQMPLVDGALSTRMIRYHEKDQYENELQETQSERPRVPIIAVSASLYENSRFDYIQSGYVYSLLPRIFEWMLTTIQIRWMDTETD